MKKETLHLNTFGEQTYRKQHCDMVKINLTKPGCEEIVRLDFLSSVVPYRAKLMLPSIHT